MRGRAREGERWGKRQSRDKLQRSEGRLSAVTHTGAGFIFTANFYADTSSISCKWLKTHGWCVSLFFSLSTKCTYRCVNPSVSIILSDLPNVSVALYWRHRLLKMDHKYNNVVIFKKKKRISNFLKLLVLFLENITQTNRSGRCIHWGLF